MSLRIYTVQIRESAIFVLSIYVVDKVSLNEFVEKHAFHLRKETYKEQ